MTLSYSRGGSALTARFIRGWERGEIIPVSGSSGLKDYVKNLVYAIFEEQPFIDRVVMVRGRGAPFLLMGSRVRTSPQSNQWRWLDSTGAEVLGVEWQSS